jgi:hypothetical protein
MNTENLNTLIDRYEENFDKIWDTEHDEWQAAKQFRDVWFSPAAKTMPFSEMFNEARKEFDILMDNSYVSPSIGIVKIAEHAPEEVARLFTDILFAEDGGDIVKRQANMDLFLEEFDALRAKYFPKSFKYKQDRHSASCYLALFAPEKNYIYRHNVSALFAQYTEYGKDIGTGQYFRLDYYYEMCDKLVEAIKKHPTLLEKYYGALGEKHYRDESLHILAFDIMYACKMHNLYLGMTYASKKESAKRHNDATTREAARIEREKRIVELQNRIYELEMQAEDYVPISLVNVSVYHPKFGDGIIVSQKINKVVIKFETCEKMFVIHKRFATRPTFENDTEIVEALSNYDDTLREIEQLKESLQKLMLLS